MKLDELKLEIARWAKREADLVRQKEVVEADAGLAMLDAEPGAGAEGHERLARTLTELRATEAALKAARSRRLEAIHAKRAAEVEAAESRRADLEKEQAALSAKIEKHRKALVELLGIEVMIVPATPARPSILQSLALQTHGLDQQVQRLRAPLPDSGTIDVENVVSVAPLIEALAAFEGVIPPMERVLNWVKSCEPAPGETFGDLPRDIRLVWAAGEIDLQRSSIFVESLCQPGPIGIYTNRPVGLNIESGTFRTTRPLSKPAVF
jgi:hypothetical protein